jgi:splicing factor U2AF subunit
MDGLGLAPPTHLAAPGATAPGGAANSMATRHARRLYVGGLPPGTSDAGLGAWFVQCLTAVGGVTGDGSPVLSVYLNSEKRFAFVEFRSIAETSNAQALHGASLDGAVLRVSRPNDYNAAAAAPLGPGEPDPGLNLTALGDAAPAGAEFGVGGLGSAAAAPAAPLTDRLTLTNLPPYLTQDQCRELLEAFGEVAALTLVADPLTGASRGVAFATFADQTVTAAAAAGLDGMRMGDAVLSVKRAADLAAAVEARMEAEGLPPPPPPPHGGFGLPLPPPPPLPAGGLPPPPPPPAHAATRVLVLDHAVTPAELADDAEHADIVDDMRDECGKHGPVADVIIPRPPKEAGAPPPPGVGRVFISFADPAAAVAAAAALHGRRFGGRAVVASYMDEADFSAGRL